MDISDANPEIIYAIVEAAERKGGFYKSINRGETWVKQSGKVTSGNYYQEIFADPVDEDVVYIMDTWMSVTHDGGKSFKNVGEDYKHVDNHAMWINPNNNSHWLVGCDGGIYETFDKGKKWDFKKNLPVTQFYKVAVDNAEPFYNIYGGTQDNFSIGGPSRVNNSHGISNQDWFITHGGDGFESQIDPENPNIVYAQSQYGWLVRYDKLSGEEVGIKPTPSIGGVGLIKDYTKMISMDLKQVDNLVLIIGKTEGHIDQSLFARTILDEKNGPPPEVNLFNEKNNGETILNLIDKGYVKSAHDISLGGLLVAISKMCIKGNKGIKINKSKNLINEIEYFFAEDQGRYLIEVNKDDLKEVTKILNKNSVHHEELGIICLLYTSPSPRDRTRSRMPSSA